jgi:hypothetical protein
LGLTLLGFSAFPNLKTVLGRPKLDSEIPLPYIGLLTTSLSPNQVESLSLLSIPLFLGLKEVREKGETEREEEERGGGREGRGRGEEGGRSKKERRRTLTKFRQRDF